MVYNDQLSQEAVCGNKTYDGTDIAFIASQFQGALFTPIESIKVDRIYVAVQFTASAGGVVLVYPAIYDSAGVLLRSYDSSLTTTELRVIKATAGIAWVEVPLDSELELNGKNSYIVGAKYRNFAGTNKIPCEEVSGEGRYQSGGTGWSPNNPAVFTAGDDVPLVFAWGQRSWKQLEPPPGFGKSPFGDPDTPEAIAIHGRGFGSPTTKWSST